MDSGAIINAGISAFDTALWDIKKKYMGQPANQLLGGKTNLRIRAYASQIQFVGLPVKKYLNQPEEYAAANRINLVTMLEDCPIPMNGN